MLVNEQPVAWVDEANVLQNREWNNEQEKPEGWIWVSHRAHIPSKGKYVHLVPKSMVLGVGCRKGTDPKALSNFILQTLDKCNIHIKSLALLTSIDVKKEEPAILEFAEVHNIPTRFYPAETLKTVEDQVNHSSAFVQQTVGVGAVSATAALIGGNKKGEFLVEKEQREGITLSIFQIK